MHLFIPYLDRRTFERTLRAAYQMAHPGDCVTVMAPVVVPGSLPVDVDAGAIWKRVCRAERHLFHAREAAERLFPPIVTVRSVRVHGRDVAATISAGAVYDAADCILLAEQVGIRGTLSARFGTIAAVQRQAPCVVYVVGPAMEEVPRERLIKHSVATNTADPFALYRTIAVNPALNRPNTAVVRVPYHGTH